MTWIFVWAGRDRGKCYPLEEGEIVIGRDEQADLQIVDEMVSRRHIKLTRKGEGADASYVLADLNSSNGVKVNGNRVTRECPLHDGDKIEIGESKLLYTVKKIVDLDTALAFMKERGQHGKNTIIR